MPAALEERRDLTQPPGKQVVRRGVSIMPFFRKTEISDADLQALAATSRIALTEEYPDNQRTAHGVNTHINRGHHLTLSVGGAGKTMTNKGSGTQERQEERAL
jgi:hypothetical protein